MLLRSLVVVGWMGLASLAISVATAEDAVAPAYMSGISFDDPSATDTYGPRFDLSFGDAPNRFLPLASSSRDFDRGSAERQIELAFTSSGLPVDVAVAPRASMTVNENGDIERQTQGAELRLGRGLGNMRRGRVDPNASSFYLFAASEDEALIWQPGQRNAFGGTSANFALQDQVEIGDMQVGVTYQRGRLQTSLAYVEREYSMRSGSRSYSQDESFAGLTMTMRH